MTLTVYALKTCDTCRKAVKALEAAGHAPRVIDIRAEGVPEEKLAAWIARFGIPVVLNTRSTTWRGLSEEERAGAGTEAGAVALIRAHPTLMKRPVIEQGDTVHVGWGKPVQAALT